MTRQRTTRILAALGALALAGCAAESAPAADGSPLPPPVVESSPQSARCLARAAADMPERLSQLGCFEDADPRWPAASMIAFAVNAPLWADGADKERFMAIPQGARIELDARG